MRGPMGPAATRPQLARHVPTCAHVPPSQVNVHVSAFHLLKDATQWGLLDEDGRTVFYVMWPPWCRHR
jgi:hypothetical protein